MNVILLAIITTGIVVLDYVLPHFEQKLKGKESTKMLKKIVAGALLLFVWWQAILQFGKESQSDRDMRFLKAQLALANASLTNSTSVVKGLTTGGDYLPEFSFSQGSTTNTFRFYLQSDSDFPVRALGLNVTDETERINNSKPDGPLLPGKEIFQRSLGDFPIRGMMQICEAQLDPYATNHFRIDLQALNGMYWEIVDIFKSNQNWALKVSYRWKQLAGQKPQIDPPERRGVLVVD